MHRVVTILLALAVLAGCAKTLTFGTATKVGLDISQRADQMIDVTFGYDRVEVASVPAPEDHANKELDTYSVLALFSVSYGNPFSLEPLTIHQFFATGEAAKKAARTPGFQELFGRRTRQIIEKKDPTPSTGGQGGGR
jgi:hypothetical protein